MRFVTAIAFIVLLSVRTAAQTPEQLRSLAGDTERCLAGTVTACDLIVPLFAPTESTHQMIVALKQCYDPSATTPFACDKAISLLIAPTTQRMIDARLSARKSKDFAAADRIRQDLAEAGVILEDSPAGTTWRRS